MEPFQKHDNSLPVVEYGAAGSRDFWHSGVPWGIVSFLAVLVQVGWFIFLIFAQLRWNSKAPHSQLLLFWPAYLAFVSGACSLWMTGLRLRTRLVS